MLIAAQIGATLLYLVPLFVVWCLRARPGRQAWQVALDVPLVTAIDLLTILALARATILESAILLSRLAWVLGGALAFGRTFARRRRLPCWPDALRGRGAAVVALAAGLSVVLSLPLSRTCHIADRAWHIPLVASLRGQGIPFANVYEPHRPLAYHFTGDVLAAVLQTLSFGTMHASLALSLAHDVMFGLIGACGALLLRSLGPRWPWFAALGGPAALLAGPGGIGGYSFIGFLKLSYRPHGSLAGLLIVGIVGAVLVNLRQPREAGTGRQVVPVLLASTSALSLTDESSIGLLGLSLGALWLLVPEALHAQRRLGALLLGGLLLAVVAPQLLFAGALAPGQPGHELALVAPRSPGYYRPPLPLTTGAGLLVAVLDLGPVALLGAALWLRHRRLPSPERRAELVFGVVLTALSVVGLTCVDIGGQAVESHRFMTAAMLALPVLCLTRVDLPPGPIGRRWLREAFPTGLVLASLILSGYATTRLALSTRCTRPANYGSPHEFFTVDCRRDVGAERGLHAAPHYLERSVWYLFAGCRPVFSSGPQATGWSLKVGLALFERPAFDDVDRTMVPEHETLTVVCPAAPIGGADVLCGVAEEAGVCRDSGEKVRICALPPALRAEARARWDGALPPPPTR